MNSQDNCHSGVTKAPEFFLCLCSSCAIEIVNDGRLSHCHCGREGGGVYFSCRALACIHKPILSLCYVLLKFLYTLRVLWGHQNGNRVKDNNKVGL